LKGVDLHVAKAGDALANPPSSLLRGQERLLGRVHTNRYDDAIEEATGALDNVQVAKRQRVERTWIDGKPRHSPLYLRIGRQGVRSLRAALSLVPHVNKYMGATASYAVAPITKLVAPISSCRLSGLLGAPLSLFA